MTGSLDGKGDDPSKRVDYAAPLPTVVGGCLTAVHPGDTEMRDMLPSEFYLGQNYPDPFSSKTTIKFCVAYRTRVQLDICNCERKMIRRLIDETKDAGTYEIDFDARGLSPASYIYILQAGEFVATKRMILRE
jgi:hypothetical protein